MMHMLFILTALLLAPLAFLHAAELAEPSGPNIGFRLLLSDQLEKKILILEKDRRISWEYAEPAMVYDGERLTNGNILYCWFSGGKHKAAGVKEVTPDKRTVFQYPIQQECHSVQRLPNGLTLIEDPVNKRLIEVDRTGAIVHELKLQVGHDTLHHIARQCRKLDNGHYLVAQEGDHAVIEYAADGAVLRRIPVNGMVYSASRLHNGNTLIGTGGRDPDNASITGRSIVEVDPTGKFVWTFGPDGFPPDTNLDWVLSVHRLPNGNSLVANFLGHGKDGKGISVLEVTPQKQVVWTYREPRIVLLMAVLP